MTTGRVDIELDAKLRLIADKLHLNYRSFRRLCMVDYVLRNKHLIPTMSETEEKFKELKKIHDERCEIEKAKAEVKKRAQAYAN